VKNRFQSLPFKRNLQRYTTESPESKVFVGKHLAAKTYPTVGAPCKSNPAVTHSSERRLVSTLEPVNVKNWFQSFAFKSLNLECEFLVSKLCFQMGQMCRYATVIALPRHGGAIQSCVQLTHSLKAPGFTNPWS
jgi:hypothetical protein